MNVSGAATGALVPWNAAQTALAPPRERRSASHTAGSSAGGGEAKRTAVPAIARPGGDPRALARFFAHGLEPLKVGTLVDTYA